MVVVKILGILDILAALIFWLFGMFNLLPKPLVTIAAFYLLIKGIFFIITSGLTSIASIIDVAIACLMFLAITVNMPKFIITLIAIFLIIKGIVSLFA